MSGESLVQAAAPTVEAADAVVQDLLAQAASQAALGAEAGSRIQQQFGVWQTSADTVAVHGLLPLALTLLILHELYESSSQDRPYRVRMVLIRTAVIAGLLLSYGLVVGLITSATGGQGEMASWSRIMGPVETGYKFRMRFGAPGLSNLPSFLIWLLFFGLLAFCALLAYTAALLLSLAQATLLGIILVLGKTCIVVSLVPGVGLGKAWARFLAMIAAWSAVAGAVSSVVLNDTVFGGNAYKLGSTDYVLLLKSAGAYLVFTIFTLAVPKITSAVFAGAGSMAPGVAGAIGLGLAGAWRGAKMVTKRRGGAQSSSGGRRFASGGSQTDSARGAARVHKTRAASRETPRRKRPAGASGAKPLVSETRVASSVRSIASRPVDVQQGKTSGTVADRGVRIGQNRLDSAASAMRGAAQSRTVQKGTHGPDGVIQRADAVPWVNRSRQNGEHARASDAMSHANRSSTGATVEPRAGVMRPHWTDSPTRPMVSGDASPQAVSPSVRAMRAGESGHRLMPKPAKDAGAHNNGSDGAPRSSPASAPTRAVSGNPPTTPVRSHQSTRAAGSSRHDENAAGGGGGSVPYSSQRAPSPSRPSETFVQESTGPERHGKSASIAANPPDRASRSPRTRSAALDDGAARPRVHKASDPKEPTP